jgi:hypothetical protein
MVEVVLRLEAHYERRVPVLLEDDRREQGGLEAMRGFGSDHSAEGAQRFSAAFDVVVQGVQPRLDGLRRTEPANERAFAGGQRREGRSVHRSKLYRSLRFRSAQPSQVLRKPAARLLLYSASDPKARRIRQVGVGSGPHRPLRCERFPVHPLHARGWCVFRCFSARKGRALHGP